MNPLLPLQEFISLASAQRKLCASGLYSIFYVDSFYVAWTLDQVPLKLLCPSICIKLMLPLATIIL
ncbi:hypothetical protein B296_00057224 [Ensete ventricosum]|uniref:Uncharacterized protein n=1 Tax=Ensete ventricosum TaxID=4639 RepID=A0A426XD90_ENSVE|nr:hypothetical protein B296_00057224 [Ensete ventricosum]